MTGAGLAALLSADSKKGGDRKSEKIKGTQVPLVSQDEAAKAFGVERHSVMRARKVAT